MATSSSGSLPQRQFEHPGIIVYDPDLLPTRHLYSADLEPGHLLALSFGGPQVLALAERALAHYFPRTAWRASCCSFIDVCAMRSRQHSLGLHSCRDPGPRSMSLYNRRSAGYSGSPNS